MVHYYRLPDNSFVEKRPLVTAIGGKAVGVPNGNVEICRRVTKVTVGRWD
jgi:hypothetical protein